MTRRKSQSRIGGQGAETGETGQMPSRRACEQRAMAFARNSVENDAGKRDRGLMTGEAAKQSGDRSALPPRIHDQHHRPAGHAGEFGSRTGLTVAARPVEQSHHAFAEDDVGAGFEVGDERREGRRPHPPDIEVQARLARGRSMKGRIDEIGPRFRCRDAQPAPEQMSRQTGGNQSFTASGSGGGEDQPAPGHDGSPRSCRADAPTQSSAARKPTTRPMTTIAGT